jgi:hypothetical protein
VLCIFFPVVLEVAFFVEEGNKEGDGVERFAAGLSEGEEVKKWLGKGERDNVCMYVVVVMWKDEETGGISAAVECIAICS